MEFSAGQYDIPSNSGMHTSSNVTGDAQNLTIEGVERLLMTDPQPAVGQVHINCHKRFSFRFMDCSDITLPNIVFTGCGSRSQYGSGALILTSITSLTVVNVTVQHSYEYGLMGGNTVVW